MWLAVSWNSLTDQSSPNMIVQIGPEVYTCDFVHALKEIGGVASYGSRGMEKNCFWHEVTIFPPFASAKT